MCIYPISPCNFSSAWLISHNNIKGLNQDKRASVGALACPNHSLQGLNLTHRSDIRVWPAPRGPPQPRRRSITPFAPPPRPPFPLNVWILISEIFLRVQPPSSFILEWTADLVDRHLLRLLFSLASEDIVRCAERSSSRSATRRSDRRWWRRRRRCLLSLNPS